MNEKILIIEDETLIADSVEYALRKEGFDVLKASDGARGLAMAREHAPDLIILDIMLPLMNGFDVCRTIRGESAVPIIMLTAKTEEVDRVVGLELGADDYVIKPFSMRELIARVKANLRRVQLSSQTNAEEIITVGDITVDCNRRVVRVGNKILHLPPKEFELLRVLAKNKDRVLHRSVLLDAVWGEDAGEASRTLDVHIRWLREKIEDDPSSARRIITIRGIGYMLVGHTNEHQD
ncbi:MAG: response regulator transcription factor [Armatimonadetes bacterium]|nr:response regulator transcription factor [Armatimonadota bacterium]